MEIEVGSTAGSGVVRWNLNGTVGVASLTLPTAAMACSFAQLSGTASGTISATVYAVSGEGQL